VFGLIILSFYLLVLHLKPLHTTYLNILKLNLSYCSLILIIYSILQLSYTLVSHNFGLNILDYGYTSFILFLLLTLLLICYFFIEKKCIYIEKYNCTFYRPELVNSFFVRNFSTKKVFKNLFTSLLIYLYFISFNPIINNVFWTTFSVEFFNNFFLPWLNIQKVLMVTIFLLFFTFTSFFMFYIILYSTTLLIKWPLLVYILGCRLNTLNLLHIIIFINLFISTLIFTSTLTIWDYSYTTVFNYPVMLSRSSYISDLLFDNFYLINSSTTVYNSGYTNLIKSFYWLGTNPSSQYFLMDSSNSMSTQSVLSHTYQYPFKLSIIDLSPFILDILTLVNLNISYAYILRKKIITL
jgi:hypothetical protein